MTITARIQRHDLGHLRWSSGRELRRCFADQSEGHGAWRAPHRDIVASNLDGAGLRSAGGSVQLRAVHHETVRVGRIGWRQFRTSLIAGHDFGGATDVSFGGQSVTHFHGEHATGTAIIDDIAPRRRCRHPVRRSHRSTGPDGTSPIVPADVFTYVAPTLAKVTPSGGPAGGNTRVSISGKYLFGATRRHVRRYLCGCVHNQRRGHHDHRDR